ncbi:MAG: hypothetical protein Q8P11_00005, partial [bacterium]|nr:hypothetical protein [bacterium]
KQYVDPAHSCEWITEEELVTEGLVTKKRSNNIMVNERLVDLGIHMRPVLEAVEDAIKKYAEAKKQYL